MVTVLPVVNKENESLWLEKAKILSRKALQECVKEEKKMTEDVPHSMEKYQNISFKVDQETELKLRKYKQKLEKERKEVITMGEVLKELIKKVKKEPFKAIGKSSKQAKKITRYIPSAIKRAAVAQTNGKCAHPGCNRPFEHLHHPKKYSIKPNHENLMPICKIHHEIVHAGVLGDDWGVRKKPILDGIDKKYLKFKQLALKVGC